MLPLTLFETLPRVNGLDQQEAGNSNGKAMHQAQPLLASYCNLCARGGKAGVQGSI